MNSLRFFIFFTLISWKIIAQVPLKNNCHLGNYYKIRDFDISIQFPDTPTYSYKASNENKFESFLYKYIVKEESDSNNVYSFVLFHWKDDSLYSTNYPFIHDSKTILNLAIKVNDSAFSKILKAIPLLNDTILFKGQKVLRYKYKGKDSSGIHSIIITCIYIPFNRDLIAMIIITPSEYQDNRNLNCFIQSLNIRLNTTIDNLDSAYYFFNEGETNFIMENYKVAVELFDKSLKYDSTISFLYLLKGMSLVKLSMPNLALKNFNSYIAFVPDDKNGYFERAILRNKLSNFTGAISDYSNIIKLDSLNADAYFNRGNCKLRLGKTANALLDYNKSIKIDSTSADVYISRGIASRLLKKYNNSISDLSKAISIDKNYGLAYYNRAITYFTLNNIPKGCTDLKAAMDLNYLDIENEIKEYCK